MDAKESLLRLTDQLFPSGRAFRYPRHGVLEALQKGLIRSEARAYEDSKSILNTILPDNDDFTADDASIWEARLALLPSTAPLEDRKDAILRKLSHPGDVIARQHYLYIQGQLRSAGFDVYVHEYQGTPIPPSVFSSVVRYGTINYGQAAYNQNRANVVANYVDEELDKLYDAGNSDNLKSCIFIGDSTYPNIATVTFERKKEFRELILRLKPAHSVAFLLINYV